MMLGLFAAISIGLLIYINTSSPDVGLSPNIIEATNQTTVDPINLTHYTQISDMDLEIIPNPTGYWVPIRDSDVFARQFANAAGEKITSEKHRNGVADYYTTNGQINMDKFFLGSFDGSSVNYKIFKLDSIKNKSEQLSFIDNFMNNMGFKLDGRILSESESFRETCEKNSWGSCISDDAGNVWIIGNEVVNSITYQFKQEASSIKFTFYDGRWADAGLSGVSINFDGWTNNQELIRYTIDENTALEKAREAIRTDVQLNKKHVVGDTLDIERVNQKICEAEIRTDSSNPTRQIIIEGIPFYNIYAARCTYDWSGSGHGLQLLILVDGWTGENVFKGYWGGNL